MNLKKLDGETYIVRNKNGFTRALCDYSCLRKQQALHALRSGHCPTQFPAKVVFYKDHYDRGIATRWEACAWPEHLIKFDAVDTNSNTRFPVLKDIPVDKLTYDNTFRLSHNSWVCCNMKSVHMAIAETLPEADLSKSVNYIHVNGDVRTLNRMLLNDHQVFPVNIVIEEDDTLGYTIYVSETLPLKNLNIAHCTSSHDCFTIHDVDFADVVIDVKNKTIAFKRVSNANHLSASLIKSSKNYRDFRNGD